jgi:hypothetical protein
MDGWMDDGRGRRRRRRRIDHGQQGCQMQPQMVLAWFVTGLLG